MLTQFRQRGLGDGQKTWYNSFSIDKKILHRVRLLGGYLNLPR